MAPPHLPAVGHADGSYFPNAFSKTTAQFVEALHQASARILFFLIRPSKERRRLHATAFRHDVGYERAALAISKPFPPIALHESASNVDESNRVGRRHGKLYGRLSGMPRFVFAKRTGHEEDPCLARLGLLQAQLPCNLHHVRRHSRNENRFVVGRRCKGSGPQDLLLGFQCVFNWVTGQALQFAQRALEYNAVTSTDCSRIRPHELRYGLNSFIKELFFRLSSDSPHFADRRYGQRLPSTCVSEFEPIHDAVEARIRLRVVVTEFREGLRRRNAHAYRQANPLPQAVFESFPKIGEVDVRHTCQVKEGFIDRILFMAGPKPATI